ncbi:MAG: hypothetical protein JRJ12_16740 [Deltaproteobacteria bacterium]|nr:hypothetical protein [Deltaproteobacteria bacterium]MBW2072971.1 hypothetical protein [Deltaproteobacteria bacterium]
MPSETRSFHIVRALIDDHLVSFNIRRPEETISPHPRDILGLYCWRQRLTIVPGVLSSRERMLLAELKKVQNWKRVKKHSFDLHERIYSWLWRFGLERNRHFNPLANLSAVTRKDARKILQALKSYCAYLQDKLHRGMIFLIPDLELCFHDPRRLKQPYSRPVMVFDVRENQISIIPFSTRVERLDPAVDILFDPSFRGRALDPDGRPAVENFPYKILARKTVLVVSAMQSLTRERFLSAALLPRGVLRPAVLELARKRMKNMGS